MKKDIKEARIHIKVALEKVRGLQEREENKQIKSELACIAIWLEDALMYIPQ